MKDDPATFVALAFPDLAPHQREIVHRIACLEPTHVALTPEGPVTGGRAVIVADDAHDFTDAEDRVLTYLTVPTPQLMSGEDMERAKRRAMFPANRKGTRAFLASEAKRR